MIDIKEQIIAEVKKALHELGIEGVIPALEHPADPTHGDFSTNVALVAFGKKQPLATSHQPLAKSPRELAEKIVELLNSKFILHNSECSRVEVAGPGFINFWLSREYLVQVMEEMQEGQLGVSQDKAGQKIMLEFTDPNPFKEFHIGHLLNITLGESWSRLLEARGADLHRASYQGDVGMHVAKAIWGLQTSDYSLQLSDLEKGSSKERAEFLGKAYAMGAQAYELDATHKKEIQSINAKLYQMTGEGVDLEDELFQLWKLGRVWSLEHFDAIYNRVGTKYKHAYFEAMIAPIGRDLVREYAKKNVFEESDGALIFRGEKYGFHTRVFVTKEGYATYEGKDLALAPAKFKEFAYDRSIIITAYEQSEYFKVVFAALALISPDLAKKTEHHAFGFVRLKEGKMSSRTGQVIAGMWLLDEAVTRIKGVFPEMDDAYAEQVGVGAVKYSMLKSSRESDIIFSFEESISLEGNSGPYIQYSYVRTKSILAKAGGGWQVAGGQLRATSHELQAEEVTLLRLLQRFPEVVEEAGDKFAPHMVCTYLFELSQAFNLFYQKHKIIGTDQEASRLMLTKAVGNVLKEGLSLLGIESPEKM